MFRVHVLDQRAGACGASVVDGLNTAIYKALMAEKITIPFPQRDVHLYQAPAS